MDIEINERPRICCVDLRKETIDSLVNEGYNIYNATLGDCIQIPNKKRHDNHQVLLNFDFPRNLHEYDIILIDLDNAKQIDYNPKEHIRTNHTGKSAILLLSSYPETIFNPRPLSSLILNEKLSQIGERKLMILVFTTGNYDIEYETVRITEGYAERQGIQKYGIYSFAGHPPISEPKYGKEMSVCNVRDDLKSLLSSSVTKAHYNQTFYHPTKWEGNKSVPDPRYVPLIKNSSGDIVSICEQGENSISFFFPQIEDKYAFISSFLKNIAPSISPELFPFSTSFSWKEKKEYWLPNHEKLIDEKEQVVFEYDKKLKIKDDQIAENKKEFLFLHELISESGDNLVNATIKFLKWLGFKNAINADNLKEEGQVLEEDIQVEFEEGLIIIECKGIAGTSTDSDCSQISKIKHRRCKERNCFDVFALYIVNHQRYLPPLQRSNPPFNENQIQDAVSDERGLLSTWQLFNLYFEVENGIITKEEARNTIIKYGLIEFKPSNLHFIDEPNEIFKDGTVCIVNIKDLKLKLGDELFIEKNGQFQKCVIEGIQLDDKPVQECSNGELGLRINIPIKKKSKLWKKTSS
jgi:hypothetical protein